MSFSAIHCSQENNSGQTNCSPSRDLSGSAEEHSITKEQTAEREDDSLVEHILDFLDRYPACLTSQPTLTRCIRAC
jgi:hypothetical protein